MTRSSFSVLFAIRESKARKNGNTPIETTITVNGERASFSTGKLVNIDRWDKTRQQVKGKDEEAKSLNQFLQPSRHHPLRPNHLLLQQRGVHRSVGRARGQRAIIRTIAFRHGGYLSAVNEY